MSAAVTRRRAAARALLAVLALSAALPGAWAAAAPHSFYDSFPGARHWVRLLPPYNGHLATDAGAFYLAFALLLAWAATTLERALVVPVCAAWALFSAIHFAYHVTHLSGYGTLDAVGQSLSLALVLVLPAAVVWLLRAG